MLRLLGRRGLRRCAPPASTSPLDVDTDYHIERTDDRITVHEPINRATKPKQFQGDARHEEGC